MSIFHLCPFLLPEVYTSFIRIMFVVLFFSIHREHDTSEARMTLEPGSLVCISIYDLYVFSTDYSELYDTRASCHYLSECKVC